MTRFAESLKEAMAKDRERNARAYFVPQTAECFRKQAKVKEIYAKLLLADGQHMGFTARSQREFLAYNDNNEDRLLVVDVHCTYSFKG